MLKAENINDRIHFTQYGSHGFFSICTFILVSILKFKETSDKLPVPFNYLQLFWFYQPSKEFTVDIMKECFEEKCVADMRMKETPRLIMGSSGQKYNKLKLNLLNRLVSAYFTPSTNIKEIINTIEKKYLIDYENTCTIYYRGTDKKVETGLAGYDEFFNKAEEILQKNPNIRFFLQTDEIEFATAFQEKFTNNFSIDGLTMVHSNNSDGPHGSLPRPKRVAHAVLFLAAVIIMSKTKHVITSSGNAALWIVLYRGNVRNVQQYLHSIHRNTKTTRCVYGWI